MTRRAATIWTWIALALLNLPILIVVIVSFNGGRYLSFPPESLSLRWYAEFLSSPDWRRALVNSLVVAFGAVALATPLAVMAALALVRSRFFGRQVIAALLTAPIVVPAIVAAVAMYFFFARTGLVGTRLSMILAHTAFVVPIVVISVSAVLVDFDMDLENAARIHGANRWRTFRWVTWPLIRPGVLSGAMFAFLMSFDELVIALFISGISGQTLPVRMWSAMRDELTPTIAAVSTLLILLSVLVVAVAVLLQRTGDRRGGR